MNVGPSTAKKQARKKNKRSRGYEPLIRVVYRCESCGHLTAQEGRGIPWGVTPCDECGESAEEIRRQPVSPFDPPPPTDADEEVGAVDDADPE